VIPDSENPLQSLLQERQALLDRWSKMLGALRLMATENYADEAERVLGLREKLLEELKTCQTQMEKQLRETPPGPDQNRTLKIQAQLIEKSTVLEKEVIQIWEEQSNHLQTENLKRMAEGKVKGAYNNPSDQKGNKNNRLL
jgi:hypothetical protein